jgi:hypothetical protein
MKNNLFGVNFLGLCFIVSSDVSSGLNVIALLFLYKVKYYFNRLEQNNLIRIELLF